MSENNVNGITGADVATTTGIIGATVGIGQYIINDYVITLTPIEGDYGYTMTITRGSETQTVTLYGLSTEQYDAMLGYLQQAQEAAQNAAGSASDAADYMDVALDAANRANSRAASAEQSSNTARSYASQAEAAKVSAETAKTDAQTARTQALGYKQSAESAANRAASAATSAGNAQTAAETAQTSAQAAETNTHTWAGQAAQSAADAARSSASAAQTLTQVQNEGATQITAIDTEGQRVLDSIPEDYTEVVSDVADLKSHLINGAQIIETDITDVDTTKCYDTQTTGVVPSDATSSNYYSQVVPVVKNDIYYVTGKGASAYRLWALTDNQRIVLDNAPGLYTVEHERIVVSQDGYLYLNFNKNNPYSVQKEESAFGQALENQKEQIEIVQQNNAKIADISYNLIDPSATTPGTLSGSQGGISVNETYYTTDFIFVAAGQSITITPNMRRLLGYSISKRAIESTYVAGPITGEYVYTADVDGYVRVSMANADTTGMIVYGNQVKAYRSYDDNNVIANIKAIAVPYADLEYPVYIGSFCYYHGALYQANQNIDTREEWTSGHWDIVTIADIFNHLLPNYKDNITNAIFRVCYNTSTVGVAPEQANSSNYYSQIIPVRHGDVFYITGQVSATSVYKLWAFANANRIITENCGNVSTATDAKLVAKIDGYLYVNFHKNYSFRLEKLSVDGSVIGNGSIDEIKIANIYGKSMLNFGDSIAAGNGNTETGESVGYADLIASRYYMTLADYAVGGATITKYSGANNYIETQVDTAITEHTGESFDFILIDGGTNDVNNAPVGSLISGYDTSNCDNTTLMGSIEIIFSKLRAAFPLSNIIYIIVHKMASRNLEKQILYHDAIIQACEKWAIPYVDIFNGGQITSYIPSLATTCFPANASTETGYDSTHPNRTGYDKFYNPQIIAKMKSLIM